MASAGMSILLSSCIKYDGSCSWLRTPNFKLQQTRQMFLVYVFTSTTVDAGGRSFFFVRGGGRRPFDFIHLRLDSTKQKKNS